MSKATNWPFSLKSGFLIQYLMENGPFRVYEYSSFDKETINRIMRRSMPEIISVKQSVEKIIKDVKERGDEAIAEFISQQIGKTVKENEIVIDKETVKSSWNKVDPQVLNAIKKMEINIKKFHKRQLPNGFMMTTERGVYAGMMYFPVDSTGLYVPSGKGSFPSVSLMLTVPASVAGVKRIAIASPPHENRLEMDPASIVAGAIGGANEFYIAGGAHAIAAFAYGTKRIHKVDTVAGPGGPYTFMAKMLVNDAVKIDLPAGPSEGAVLSDGNADVLKVAWNVLNEAEHGPDSIGLLLTTSRVFAMDVINLMNDLINRIPEPRKSFLISSAQKYSGALVFNSMDELVKFVYEFAPEHLAIESKNANKIFNKYKGMLRAGTIVINTPFSAGNYGIGPNSTLPTNGFAKMYSGLNVMNFIRSVTYEKITLTGWKNMVDTVKTMASYEGFPSHKNAMECRNGGEHK
ncbi:MAG: histidinol dehydrogenase [Nitrososphaeria archaeon]